MSKVREQKETAIEDGVDQKQTPHLSTSFFYLLVAGWLAWIVRYAELSGTIFGTGLYGLASFSLLVSLGFFIGELRRTPQLRRFLGEILPLKDVLFPWRPAADIWTAGIALVFFLGVCVSIHYLAFAWLDWTGIAAALAIAVVIVGVACACAIALAAVEQHIIKPFLHFLSGDDENVTDLTRRVRKLLLAVTGVLGFAATLLSLNDYLR